MTAQPQRTEINGADLCELLTALTEADEIPARQYAASLRAAGMFAADNEIASLDHAINFLLAVAVARCPADAPDAARTLGDLPALSVIPFFGLEGGSFEQAPAVMVEDIPINPGKGGIHTRQTCSARSAIAYAVEQLPIDGIRAGRIYDDARLRWLTIARDLKRPHVELLHVVYSEGKADAAELSYLKDSPKTYQVAPALSVAAVFNRTALYALADYFSLSRSRGLDAISARPKQTALAAEA